MLSALRDSCLCSPQVKQRKEIAPGVLMPMVGFGTAGLGDYTADVSLAAIKAGYRLLDGAEVRVPCPQLL